MNDEVRKFVVDALDEMNYDVTDSDDNTPVGSTGLDLESLAVAELAIRVEDTYQVKFGDDEMEALALMTISQFVGEIVARMEAATAGSSPE